ncbi:peptidase C45 acyl-coenzyme A:6-aminopenicillanic acid acyl-transferase [Sporocytophaga myxococcoides]|uniref:Peptidase C45 acyl-coenzyme A:6-aminopenicillanic acid acyl-transferase n=1 Tax=Sporocytophaga myxococcoides TaxID=153721 RepID=A0A098LHB1_9BACT|nr:C45 family peptidase [Sporocytophaga myxococcoides]GAL85829.1 peptidase C45 acyl-coenzyme A:6-aminopenicillanic acid acyl-transferase [Sporocytophaga myxococcoides]
MNRLFQEHTVHLDLLPDQRWAFLIDYKEAINDLLQCYLNDFEGADFIFDNIELFKNAIISEEYLKEIDFIASISNFSPSEVLIANLYYDILKFYFGCTAFAVSNGQTVMHGRNLDWHTENNLLGKHSLILNFKREGKTLFKTIGWPGFIGTLSGIRPGKFSLTLNAVLSGESPEIAVPISFLLRDILTSSSTFQEAKQKLENTKIASDCLILLSGILADEKVVIERTPNRSATRASDSGYIIVTNDYKKIQNNTSAISVLQATSCGRYERTEFFLKDAIP